MGGHAGRSPRPKSLTGRKATTSRCLCAFDRLVVGLESWRRRRDVRLSRVPGQSLSTRRRARSVPTDRVPLLHPLFPCRCKCHHIHLLLHRHHYRPHHHLFSQEYTTVGERPKVAVVTNTTGLTRTQLDATTIATLSNNAVPLASV